MCAGRLDASIEEVASILRSSSEIEHNASMTALYAKSFIFGSYEREVSCCKARGNQDDNVVHDDSGEQLVVKTKSFARTTMLGRNEQWCYYDYFQRKKERDGFTISKRALPPSELTPGRILGENAHVDQLHDLNASYLVDKLPNRKGLRVVFHAWFDSPDTTKSLGTTRSTSSPGPGLRSKSFDYGETTRHKAQMRRLLAMAHGVTNLPDLIRRRRFGAQIPADLAAVSALNARCPCCTHSLSLVKSTLAKAASALLAEAWLHSKWTQDAAISVGISSASTAGRRSKWRAWLGEWPRSSSVSGAKPTSRPVNTPKYSLALPPSVNGTADPLELLKTRTIPRLWRCWSISLLLRY